ncbi:hypothetical protein P8605_15430 [Streptomyces sp. T-3]|nr:hypothetical protein [Streptomyces sp. T-3]
MAREVHRAPVLQGDVVDLGAGTGLKYWFVYGVAIMSYLVMNGATKAKLTQTSGPDGSTVPRQAAATWVQKLPGIESSGGLSITPACMTEANGCTWAVTSMDSDTEPTALHAQNGKFVLQIEVGSPVE